MASPFLVVALLALLVVPRLEAVPPAAQKPAPSKIAEIVRQRAAVLARTLSSRPLRRLAVPEVAALSDSALRVDAAGRLLLIFHAAQPTGEKEKRQLTDLGAWIERSTSDPELARGQRGLPNLGMIVAWVPYDQIDRAAGLSWVVAVTPAETPHFNVGSVTSQGVKLHRADVAQNAGFDGTGVRIGVVSNGVVHLASAVASGDLPTGVTVQDAGTGDEGTAMLEIVHDMAPKAQLYFHASGSNVVSYVAALEALATAGVDVIAEDIAFDTEPAFEKGIAAAELESLAGRGISVYGSIGNLGDAHASRVRADGTGHGPDGYDGPFTGCTISPTDVVDLDPGPGTAFDLQIAPGSKATVVLQWSEPRQSGPSHGGGFTDLDLFLLDASGKTCLAQASGTQGGGNGDTIEVLTYTNTTGNTLSVKLAVNRTASSGAVASPLIDLRWRGAGAVDPTDRRGSIDPNENVTTLASTVAAASAAAGTDATQVPLESYSAGGPVHLESTTVCDHGAYPCAQGVAGSIVFDGGGASWTAADEVSVSGAGGFPTTFGGTSASAPHAAGCDALIRQQLQGEG
ncbi:MAG TPA: hypothetical protein VMM92_10165, partial [Thermoanaerobaculia bacterium]|nr:hypothetical protein [Thermoanaerobaculia bacterium]